MADELRPPWVVYGNVDPWWGGWRQGYGEAWLRDTWLPFWLGLTRTDREAYLKRWPPPNDDWREYMLDYWVKWFGAPPQGG